jgi:hypothetical protein
MFGVLSRLSITAFFCLIWLPALLPAQDFPALRDSSQLLAVPQGLPGPTAGTAVSDDPMLVEFSQKAHMAAMSARLEHYRDLGFAFSESSDVVNVAVQRSLTKQSNLTVLSIGGTDDEPSGTVNLPVNPALSCPGFYIVRSHAASNSEEGRFGLELLLRGEGRRTLQGGLNFGGRATSSVRGFSAFNIANSSGEDQLVNIGINVGAPGRLTLERRSQGQVVATPLDTNISSGESSFSVTVPVGFYVVGYTPSTSASTRYAISALSSYVDRPGGGFQGGVVVGGFHDPSLAAGSTKSTGFAGFCIAEAHEVKISVLSRPTYGSSGATGMEFSVSGNDGTVFLESRNIESNPEIFLSNAVDSIAGYPGIFMQTEVFIPEEARTRVSALLEATPEALDFLLDFFVIVVMSDLADEELRAFGVQLNHGEAFLAQARILVNDGVFLWLDLDAITALPVGDLLGDESEIDLDELIDALLLELDALGLSDISQALAAGQPLQLTGFEDVLDPATIVPGPDTAQQISESLSAFLTDVASATFLESTENGDWIRTETDTSKLIKFLLDLAGDLGLDEAGEGDLFTLEEIEALIDELELAPTVIGEFLISEGELIFMTIELASLDPTLGLNLGDIWLDLYLGRYTDSVLPFENAVLFDLCRLPEDTFDCSP